MEMEDRFVTFRMEKAKHIAIISCDIPPTMLPKRAPIPVVIPDNTT